MKFIYLIGQSIFLANENLTIITHAVICYLSTIPTYLCVFQRNISQLKSANTSTRKQFSNCIDKEGKIFYRARESHRVALSRRPTTTSPDNFDNPINGLKRKGRESEREKERSGAISIAKRAIITLGPSSALAQPYGMINYFRTSHLSPAHTIRAHAHPRADCGLPALSGEFAPRAYRYSPTSCSFIRNDNSLSRFLQRLLRHEFSSVIAISHTCEVPRLSARIWYVSLYIRVCVNGRERPTIA